ncbi:MAG TPA: T9SS type A sorting domain-containing protein [Ignavibacteriaceae bacterium]|nr:T9SS type A sorting domain-containing protein [Ignavibacteriaceae bacterium]
MAALPPGNINNVIAGDTTATGARKDPNRVYVLQQTGSVDTTYFFTATINMDAKFNGLTLTIIGKNNPVTGMPPVIEPFILSDNSTPPRFTENLEGNLNFDNLYFLGKRTDGLITAGDDRLLDGIPVGSSIRINHCVFDDFTAGQGALLSYGGSGNSFYITNCEFRNIQSQAGFPTNIIFAEAADTLQFVNNTFFAIAFGVWGNDNLRYFQFKHNTMVGCAWMPLRIYQADSAYISDNIFYDTYAWGYDSTSIKNGGVGNEPPAVIVFDSLFQFSLPPYTWTEAGRNIVVENNAYFWQTSIDSTITAINSTATDYVVAPTWMDSHTQAMFADKTSWPGLSASNNVNTDPGFSASIVDPMVAGLNLYTVARWNGTISTSPLWRQMVTNPANVFGSVATNWAQTQGYPVPENLKYTANLTGSDGLPLGDLNWFPEVMGIKQTNNVIPEKFILKQNYPNPFNPTTNIKYSITKSGLVTLKIYNVLGQEVATLVNQDQRPGNYVVDFNASNLASGVYMYRLESGNYSLTKKMVLLK